MSVSQHRHKDPQNTQNQKNQMSEDPSDGARGSDTLGRDEREPFNRSPEEKAQRDPEALEEFGEEGSGEARE